MDNLRERLAADEHDRWARWQRYLHSCCEQNPDGSITIPAVLVERWERQIITPYEDLSEAEKESDRREADRILQLLSQ